MTLRFILAGLSVTLSIGACSHSESRPHTATTPAAASSTVTSPTVPAPPAATAQSGITAPWELSLSFDDSRNPHAPQREQTVTLSWFGRLTASFEEPPGSACTHMVGERSLSESELAEFTTLINNAHVLDWEKTGIVDGCGTDTCPTEHLRVSDRNHPLTDTYLPYGVVSFTSGLDVAYAPLRAALLQPRSTWTTLTCVSRTGPGMYGVGVSGS